MSVFPDVSAQTPRSPSETPPCSPDVEDGWKKPRRSTPQASCIRDPLVSAIPPALTGNRRPSFLCSYCPRPEIGPQGRRHVRQAERFCLKLSSLRQRVRLLDWLDRANQPHRTAITVRSHIMDSCGTTPSRDPRDHHWVPAVLAQAAQCPSRPRDRLAPGCSETAHQRSRLISVITRGRRQAPLALQGPTNGRRAPGEPISGPAFISSEIAESRTRRPTGASAVSSLGGQRVCLLHRLDRADQPHRAAIAVR